MTIPTNVEVIENEVARCWIEDDILVLFEKPSAHTFDDFRDHKSMVMQLTEGRIIPALVYLKTMQLPDSQTREFVADSIQSSYSALALVSNPEVADESIRNYGLEQASIPIRNFTDDWAAKEWLSQFKK